MNYNWREHAAQDEKLAAFDPTKVREFTPRVRVKGDKKVAVIGASAKCFIKGRGDDRQLGYQVVEVGYVVLEDPKYKADWDDKSGENPGDAPGSVHYQSYFMFSDRGFDHKFGRLCKTIQPRDFDLKNREQLTNALRNPEGKGGACFTMGFTRELQWKKVDNEKVPIWRKEWKDGKPVKDSDGNDVFERNPDGSRVQATRIEAPFACNLVPYEERSKTWGDIVRAGYAEWDKYIARYDKTVKEIEANSGGGGGYGGDNGGGYGGGGGGGYGGGGGGQTNPNAGFDDDIPF